MHLLRRVRAAIFFAAALPFALQAQNKKPLDQAAWDRWESIASPTLSPDGKWAAYTLNPRVGDGQFVVRSTSGTAEYRTNVGYTNRDNNIPGTERGRGGAPAGGGGGRGGRGGGGGPTGVGPFSADGKFAFVMVNQATKSVVDSVEKAARGRGVITPNAPTGPATNQLRIVRTSDGNVETVNGARSFRLADANPKWLAYATGDSAPAAGDGAAGGGRGGRGGRGGGAPAAAGTRRTYGNPLTLRNLDTGAEEKLDGVTQYTFDDSAHVLAYTVALRTDSTKDGVYLRDLATGQTRTVISGPGNYRAFTFDRTQQQFAFTTDKDEFGRTDAKATVYTGNVKTGSAAAVLSTSALPATFHIAEGGPIAFTRAGNALTVTIAPPREEAVAPDSMIGKAKFDLWHFQDAQIQPTQLLQVQAALNRTYQGIVNLQTKKFTRLTDENFPNAQLSDNASVGLSATNVPYALSNTWGDGGQDVYVLDPATGTRKQVAKKISGQSQLSPAGKYIAYYDTKHWFAHNIATGKTVDLNAAMKGHHFENETDDHPAEAPAWGVAGWTKDDKSVLIYDRWDIWDFDPSGARAPIVLTDSAGRKQNIQLRLLALGRDDEERALDPAAPAWLSAFADETKESGFYRTTLASRRAPEKVVMAPVRYGNPTKADKADVYMLTKSTFKDFPNLLVGNSIVNATTKISNANAFQSEYNWGTAERVNWTSMDGLARTGILFKPENFDPKKKYPMITYFYEDLSDGLYSYIAPNGGTSVNITQYVSNGYIMFEPDIQYETGHPGQSAVKAIVPGVQKIVDQGFVDPKKLGLQGHSWGGYQTAYLITQTNMFAAAEAGAPVSNMISAYGGIRWESGVNRAMQYEGGQSRIGKTIEEGLPLYIENSPLFSLSRVSTPLLILHNDQDGAVPWYQGIELYIGMRRLEKEAYMFNYNGEPHGIQGRANQKDWANRMMTFFDVKLKGSPEPDWMKKGIAAKDKGKDVQATKITP